MFFRYLLLFTCPLLIASGVHAEIRDPYDPFDRGFSSFEASDEHKTAAELLLEAEYLLIEERPLDARSKLLKALRKEPDNYQAHTLLSGYYLVHVGHFRLALRYIRQARNLFEERYGPPPYLDPLRRNRHSHIVHLQSQARLNLDDYQGALDLLDEYADLGYMSDWYHASRAWILMKLGRMDEAIYHARTGLTIDREPGRTLNILGILLSMSGRRHEAVSIFEQAIAREFAAGRFGQPAVPLNNIGEVFRELFEEDDAERAWLRSTSLPDGCEHVLPSLNLAILYIEQTKYREAKETMDRFESCVAQYPLRNGEEHRALVHLARGRIDLLTGFPERAATHFKQTLERRQWFGKIGATEQDLQVGAFMSLAQALRRFNAHERLRVKSGLRDSTQSLWVRTRNSLQAFWYMRKARKLLVEELDNIEDLFIRNTDSVLEYPSLGEVLRGFPSRVLERRVREEMSADSRERAQPYYKGYLAENLLSRGNKERGRQYLSLALSSARDRYDQALSLHLLTLKLRYVELEPKKRQSVAESTFLLSRAALRNYGIALPVNYEISDRSLRRLFRGSALELDNSPLSEFVVSASRYDGGGFEFIFRSRSGIIQEVKVRGDNAREAAQEFIDSIFTQKL